MAKPKKKRSFKDAAKKPDTIFVCKQGTSIPLHKAFNVRVALHKLKKKVSYDELADRILINDRLIPADWVLDDLRVALDDQFDFHPTKDLFNRAIGEAARRNPVHPIREYLDGLKWDQEKRLDDMLMMYFGAEDTPFNRAVGKIIMVAAVRRMRIKIVEGDEAVKFDQMLILEGHQGSEKSTAIKILAGGNRFFTDALPLKNDSKIFLELVTGKWFVEFGELAGIGKRDVESLKAMLSKETDRARLAYDRVPMEKPRTCIFIGTTNTTIYLKDLTGNRRFWPVKTGQINLDDLERDRDQLWAEAAHLEAKGESIVLDQALWAEAAKVQLERTAADPWEDPLLQITRLEGIAGEWGKDADGKRKWFKYEHPKSLKIRASDLWEILNKRLENRTQADNARLGVIMGAAGFDHRNQRFAGGSPQSAYTLRRGDQRPVTVKVFHSPHDQGVKGVRVSTVVDGVKDDGTLPMDLDPGPKDDDIPF